MAPEGSSLSTPMLAKSTLYSITAVVTLGGVLFGYDLVIVSGAVPFFTVHFRLNEVQTGWAVGCINLGAAMGALLAGKLSDTLGRKKSLLLCAGLFALTGLGMGWAINFASFVGFRLLGGVAVGAAALVCPMYIAEIAPSGLRGRLVSFYQLAIVTGLLLAYVADYGLLNTGADNWRWMFSSQSVPGLLFLLGLVLVPESPRWLAQKHRPADALRVLTRIGGPAYAQTELEQIDQAAHNQTRERLADLLHPSLRRIVGTGILIAVFSQAGGQNSLFSYAPQIFRQAGVAGDSAFLQSGLLGLINFVFTFIAIGTIDRIGRRRLLLYGSILLAADGLALAVSFAVGAPAYWILSFVLGFVAIYAATLGPVTWVVLSELFPGRIRGNGMGVATLALWLANFITTASFPILRTQVGLAGTFGIHAVICLLYFFFVQARVPETKGRSLEEIERLLTGR